MSREWEGCFASPRQTPSVGAHRLDDQPLAGAELPFHPSLCGLEMPPSEASTLLHFASFTMPPRRWQRPLIRLSGRHCQSDLISPLSLSSQVFVARLQRLLVASERLAFLAACSDFRRPCDFSLLHICRLSLIYSYIFIENCTKLVTLAFQTSDDTAPLTCSRSTEVNAMTCVLTCK